jgi:hypothetical protein
MLQARYPRLMTSDYSNQPTARKPEEVFHFSLSRLMARNARSLGEHPEFPLAGLGAGRTASQVFLCWRRLTSRRACMPGVDRGAVMSAVILEPTCNRVDGSEAAGPAAAWIRCRQGSLRPWERKTEMEKRRQRIRGPKQRSGKVEQGPPCRPSIRRLAALRLRSDGRSRGPGRARQPDQSRAVTGDSKTSQSRPRRHGTERVIDGTRSARHSFGGFLRTPDRA